MRRSNELVISLIQRTVPMLFAIGAVLSVLLQIDPSRLWVRVAACVAWGLTAAGAIALLAIRCFRKERKPESDRLEQERDRFLSDVAHELKTPLTVIRGSAEIMADGAVPVEEYPAYCARILRETEAMSRLVSDLLDVSRMRSGTVRFEPRDTDLTVLAQGVCEGMSTVAEQTGVCIRFVAPEPPLPVLLLDYDRIRQLAVILLDNAVKHTPEGGIVQLRLERSGDDVLLCVTDTGSGIAPEDLPYVFERFYKADPERGGLPSGSGIGLSLALRIARMHGGDLTVSSVPGEGSRFTARLPMRICETEEADG